MTFTRKDLESWGKPSWKWSSYWALIYDGDTLNRTIERIPLRRKDVYTFLRRRTFLQLIRRDPSKGSISPSRKPLTHRVTISLDLSLEEQGVTLIHEVIHGYYRAKSSRGHDGRIDEEGERLERYIEKYAQRFYTENRDFVDSLIGVLKLKQSPEAFLNCV